MYNYPSGYPDVLRRLNHTSVAFVNSLNLYESASIGTECTAENCRTRPASPIPVATPYLKVIHALILHNRDGQEDGVRRVGADG